MGNGLPHPPQEFRLELLRRLDLLDREIRALDAACDLQGSVDCLETLRSMGAKLRERLDGEFTSAAWVMSRVELIGMWKRYRQAFEKLAAECRQSYPARPGRRDGGPRW